MDTTISTTTCLAELAHLVTFGMKINMPSLIQMPGYGMQMGLTDMEVTLTAERKILYSEPGYFLKEPKSLKRRSITIKYYKKEDRKIQPTQLSSNYLDTKNLYTIVFSSPHHHSI